MHREFIVSRACDEIVSAIRRELEVAGFRVEQSFDLRSALALVPDCTCPHHGTALCNCQYNVLLVYGRAQTPASLVVHGHDNRCWIALADDPNGQAAPALMADILYTLAVVHLTPPDEAVGAAYQVAAS